MTKLTRCACCDGPLEPTQQLRFLVETDTLDNPVHLARIRMLPSVNGRPVPVCRACQKLLESAPPAPEAPKPAHKPKAAPLSLATGLLGALGALSVGWLLGALASRG